MASNEVSNLLRREADIALRMVQPDQSSLVARRIGTVALGVYAHRDYLQRRGTPKQLSDLLTHDLVGSDLKEEIFRGLAAMGCPVTRESLVFRTDDLMAYWHAVKSGIGIGFVAQYMARTDAALVPLLPTVKIPPLPLWLAVHREIRTNRRMRAVYDYLVEALPAALDEPYRAAAPATRQTTLPTSSATSSAPRLSMATPTGRP